MQSDTIKLLSSYLTAVVLAVGGTILLVYVWLQPGVEGKDGVMALIAGIVGGATTFLFTGNAAVAGVRTFQSGLYTPAPPKQDT